MNDIEIKQKMYKEYENKQNIINIKDELLKSMQSLKDDELVHSSNFRLEDTMSAFVINHYKMDPHSHNDEIKNVNDKDLKLKKLYSFSYKDTLYTIFDLFKKEISLIYNVPIHECYLENTLSFISEEHIDISNFSDLSHINYNIVSSFVLSFKYVIYLIFNDISNNSCLRDEDLPSFLYSNVVHLNKPMAFEFLEKIIKYLETSEKNEENKKDIEQILSIVKLQKGIIGILLMFYNDKSKENEQKKEIKLTKDNYNKVITEILEEVNKIKYEEYPKEIEKDKEIYKKGIYKLMPVLGSFKKCNIFSGKDCIDKFKELLTDFKELRRIFNTTNLYHLYKLIHNINSKKEINSPSFVIRHIIDINIINEDKQIFGNKSTMKFFKNLFKEYKVNPSVSSNDKDNENDMILQIIDLYQEILKYELKNRARKVREARDLINNFVGLVISIYKKEKELNEESQNTHQHKPKELPKSLIKNFVVFKLLKIMLSILFNCFRIDFFKFYELDYIFFVCEQICNQIVKHVQLFARNIDDNEIMSENNIANSEKKKNFKDEKKVLFDEIYIYKGYKNAFQGLKLLLYYIKYYKLIKMPELTEADIAMRISNRCPFFKNCSMIINLSYGEFIKDWDEYISHIEDEKNIDLAKDLLLNSKKDLMVLKSAQQSLRDIFMNGNEEINELSKVIIANSFIFSKVKKFKEEQKENEYMKFNININKYNSKLPLLEIQK